MNYYHGGKQKELVVKETEQSSVYTLTSSRTHWKATWFVWCFLWNPSFCLLKSLYKLKSHSHCCDSDRMKNRFKENKCLATWRLLSWIRPICFVLFCFLKYPVVRNAFFCLETASEKNISDVYTQALMAYAFCLAGKAEKCESFLRELQKSAKEVGEFQPFWEFGKWEEGTDLTDGMWSNLGHIESIATWTNHHK